MKKLYIIILSIFISVVLNAQIVNIPDANFKNALVNTNCADLNGDGYYNSDADLNDDGEIQVAEAVAILGLNLVGQGINSLEGLDSFLNIKSFRCLGNNITTLDLSFITEIEHDLVLSGNQNLVSVNLNTITSIGGEFVCYNNTSLTNLNLEALVYVGEDFSCQANTALVNINLQNLYEVEASLSLNNNDEVITYNLPSLYEVGELFRISGHYSLSNLYVNALNNVKTFEFTDNVTLSSLDVPNLITANGVTIQDNNNLISISFNSLNSITYGDPPFGACRIIENPIIETINLESLINVDGSLLIDGSNNLNTLEIANLIHAGNINMEFIEIPSLNLSNLQTVGNDIEISAITNTLNTIDLSSLQSVTYDLDIWSNGLSIVNLDSLQSINELKIFGNFNEISFPSLVNEIYKIDLSDNINLTNLDFSNITGLHTLDLSNNNISTLNISNLESATNIYLDNNNLTTLNLESLTNALSINLGYNNLVDLNLSNLETVNYLTLTNNAFTFIDLSTVEIPSELQLYGNTNLTTLYIKNGSETNNVSFNNCPNLAYICADDFEINQIQNYDDTVNMSGVNINTYCSFVPGGDYFTLEGTSILDSNIDGCDNSDSIYPELNFNITNGSNYGNFISGISGDYSIALQEGNYSITPILENPSYFNISPSSLDINFPNDGSPLVQDFCIVPNGTFNDLEIIVIPLTAARPGFEAQYRLIYKNIGNSVLSGDVEFYYSDNSDVSNFVSASPTEVDITNGVVTWNYTGLQPFETRVIDIVLSLNTPTDPNNPLNSGDILSYFAKIYPIVNDQSQPNNTASLRQEVVNSLDPNDKRCLEGETISPENVGEFVHYMVRFENTGTASAINVVVKDEIDTNKFDINTLVPLHASHNFVTRIRNFNEVEFIFESINLPFADANNDGYVVFKIKTLDTLVLGDTFSNEAEIYFDFNFPIITNDFETTIEENLSVNEFDFHSAKLYPNPTDDTVYISSDLILESVRIYDLNGRLLSLISADSGENMQSSIDLSELTKGVYFIELISGKLKSVYKIVRN